MKIAGFLVLGLGWLMMLFGVSSGSGLSAGIANLHAMNIAQGLIITGGFLIVAGSIGGLPKGSQASADRAVTELVAATTSGDPVDPAALRARIEEAKRRAG